MEEVCLWPIDLTGMCGGGLSVAYRQGCVEEVCLWPIA